MTKDVIEAIKERRSVRAFLNETVNEATLSRILEAATWAPSAGNIQPWEFYVVENNEIKNRLQEIAPDQPINNAPVAVIICADLLKSSSKYGERGRSLYCIQDTACAVQNMMLAANAFGLDTLWIGAFDENKVKEALNISDNLRPMVILLIGFGEMEPTPPSKRNVNEVIHFLH